MERQDFEEKRIFSTEEDDIDRDEEKAASHLDSRTNQIHDLLIEKFQAAIHKTTAQVIYHDLVKIAIEHDPIDIAHTITYLPQSVRHVIYENLPDMRAKMSFMINAPTNTRIAIFRYISDEEIKKLIEDMPTDEAVFILEDLADRRLRRVLELLDIKKATKIRELQKHGRYTAGRLMTNEFFAFPPNTTIGEVARTIRDNHGIEFTRSIFVLNEEQELVGFVPARNLLVNPDDIPIKHVMRPILYKVYPETTREEVVEIVERYNIPTLPVVDEDNHLLGIITYEDVFEAIQDLADEMMASIGGTAEDISEDEPISKRLLWRAPWLVVTLCAGLISATGLATFIDKPWFAIVPFFVPLITGMSGNVGIQCSTIFVRGMATGEISAATKWDTVRREIKTGLLIGIIFGILCGAVVFLLNTSGIHQFREEPIVVSTIVSAGVFGACMTATFLGTLSPLFFAKIRIDPAVASGPIVTAFNDVLSTFMYFLVAKIISTLFHGDTL